MKKGIPAIAKHPRSGREIKIDTAIYLPFKQAILQSLRGTKGKTFTALTNDVSKLIPKKIPGFTGSIPWYTITVRFDLETKGMVEIYTENRKKLIRLAPGFSR